jgi:hypothetical protein
VRAPAIAAALLVGVLAGSAAPSPRSEDARALSLALGSSEVHADGLHGHFTVSGAPISSLVPGGPAVPIDLTFTNPTSAAIVVTSVRVAVQPITDRRGCNGSRNLAVTRQFVGHVVVPPRRTVVLSTATPSVARSSWPAVRLTDAAFDQSACLGATFRLDFHGLATG